MRWRIEELTLSEGDPVSDAWLEVHHAANRAVWGPEAERATLAQVLDVAERRHELRRAFGLWVDGRHDTGGLVAAAHTIRSSRDNVDTAGLWLSVHPDHQRLGLGSELLSHCEWSLREEGCRRIHDHSGAPLESGDAATAFANAHGYRQTQLDLRQDLLVPLDAAALAASETLPDPAAYLIETAVDALPVSWLEDRALLARRMSTDAPTGDIDLDEEDWDPERVARLWNTPSPVWGVESVARHVPTGRLVGFSDIFVRPGTPTLGVQGDTLVLREHRGHALGLALKLANLRALARARPEVVTVRTWNAESNTPMLGVNRRLGFRVTGWTREWVKEL